LTDVGVPGCNLDNENVANAFKQFLKEATGLRNLSFDSLFIDQIGGFGIHEALSQALTRSNSTLQCIDVGDSEFWHAFPNDSFRVFLDAVMKQSQLERLKGIPVYDFSLTQITCAIPSLMLKELQLYIADEHGPGPVNELLDAVEDNYTLQILDLEGDDVSEKYENQLNIYLDRNKKLV